MQLLTVLYFSSKVYIEKANLTLILFLQTLQLFSNIYFIDISGNPEDLLCEAYMSGNPGFHLEDDPRLS